ncbi:MAG: VOC family protein [Planctomycetaceae bacterium]|nr:VOC family protein [Planctomycetaceae bacterium]
MSDFQIGPVRQIALSVRDLARATAFYRDTLGLPLLFEVPRLAFFNLHGIRLMLSTGEGEGPPKEPHGTVLYYETADLSGTFATLRERGAKIIREPHLIAKMPDHELWMAFLEDSEGNLFGVMSEVRAH